MMATMGQSGLVARQLERLFGRGTVSGLSEGQLLARFVRERDESAFEVIVTRHGPMVLGICRRLLDDPRDVEDAFQATFLILVKKAGSLRDRELLANWLYGVAARVARRSRRDRLRRFSRERTGVAEDARARDGDSDSDELRSSLDAEVARLPEKFRVPVILCYFEGLTHDEAAERLRCPVGTVRSRMAKARELLRSRLTRRGVVLAPASTAVTLVPQAIPPVPRALMDRTIAVAMRVATGQAVAGAGSASVALLTLGFLRTMSLTKALMFAVVVATLSAVGGGVGLAARQIGTEPTQAQPAQDPADARPESQPESRPRVTANRITELEDRIKRDDAEIEKLKSDVIALRASLKNLGTLYFVNNTGGGMGSEEGVARLKDLKAALDIEWPGQLDSMAAKVRARDNLTKRVPSGGAAPEGSVGQNAPPEPGADDVIMAMNPRTIVIRSARANRLIMYDTKTGRELTRYRPPDDGRTSLVMALPDLVHITAVGPKTTMSQLAVYSADRGQWATQDFHGLFGSFSWNNVRLWSAQLASVTIDGENVTHLAVFDRSHFQFALQELREPIDKGPVTPDLDQGLAYYIHGRSIYAYSALAGRWDVLTLERPLTHRLNLPRVFDGLRVSYPNLAVSQGGNLYFFRGETGRWQAIEPKD
jgi:RNA polymerase sigma factor (sigma-70 family)